MTSSSLVFSGNLSSVMVAAAATAATARQSVNERLAFALLLLLKISSLSASSQMERECDRTEDTTLAMSSVTTENTFNETLLFSIGSWFVIGVTCLVLKELWKLWKRSLKNMTRLPPSYVEQCKSELLNKFGDFLSDNGARLSVAVIMLWWSKDIQLLLLSSASTALLFALILSRLWRFWTIYKANRVLYVKECKSQLFQDFDFLSDEGALYFANTYSNYATCHRIISNRIMGRPEHLLFIDGQASDEAYVVRLKQALGGAPLTFEQHERMATRKGEWTTLQYHRRNEVEPVLTVIQGEVKETRELGRAWLDQIETAQPRAECQCCFDTLLLREMVSCEEKGHLFCKQCVQKLVEHQVFSSSSFGEDKSTGLPNLETKCMHLSGACNSAFENLDQVLPDKLKEKYEQSMFVASLNLANILGLSKCPRCPYLAILDPESESFPCPNCQVTSCRKCGEDPHPGQSCAKKTAARITIEEAKSNILIRTCPNPLCQKELLKDSGCNRMTCKCGTSFCYVCRQRIRISGYDHFCRMPHCTHENCNKCELWSSTEYDDEKAMAEAELKLAREARVDQPAAETGSESQRHGFRKRLRRLLRRERLQIHDY